MAMFELPPFVPFFVGAFFALLTRGTLRVLVMLAVPILGGVNLWLVTEGAHWQLNLLEYELTPFRVDRLSLVFGYVFHIAAFISLLFAANVRDTVQHVAAMMYAGSALGAVFAGDLITLFVFWELLALSSVFLIWARRTQRAYRSGVRYIIIKVLSGLLLLVGALFYARANGTLEFSYIGLSGIHGWLIFTMLSISRTTSPMYLCSFNC